MINSLTIAKDMNLDNYFRICPIYGLNDIEVYTKYIRGPY